ncbi:hypothetical protein BDZ97DRAFT_1923277 [Flammula alnicola]|nr:hypothetical protein BDZ97DRAFT_1923277 [Flammula alnicola]
MAGRFHNRAPNARLQTGGFAEDMEVGVASGHYPSTRSIPLRIGLTEPLVNPATPPQPPTFKPSRYRSPGVDIVTEGRGAGPKRVYLTFRAILQTLPIHLVQYLVA